MCKRTIEAIKDYKFKATEENAIFVAKLLLATLNINTYPVDISKILNGLGFRVFIQNNLPSHISGYIRISEDLIDKYGTHKIISVNENDSPGRRRFTLGHEFYHYMFDYDSSTKNYADFYDTDATENNNERFANRFASEFLMPEKLFRNEYNYLKSVVTNKTDIKETLVEKFNVSFKAVERRFNELGIKDV